MICSYVFRLFGPLLFSLLAIGIYEWDPRLGIGFLSAFVSTLFISHISRDEGGAL